MTSSVLGKRHEMEDQQTTVNIEEPAQKRQKPNIPNKQYYVGPADYLYTDLEVVWGRLEDFPWWPGQIDMTHLPNGDRGGTNTPRLPVKWFGEDSHLTHWLERSRVTSFKVTLEDRLMKDIAVEDEDLQEYNGAVEHAIHRQTKWIQEKKREARKRAKISDPEYNPMAYNQNIRRSSSKRKRSVISEESTDEENDNDDEYYFMADADKEYDISAEIDAQKRRRKKKVKTEEMENNSNQTLPAIQESESSANEKKNRKRQRKRRSKLSNVISNIKTADIQMNEIQTIEEEEQSLELQSSKIYKSLDDILNDRNNAKVLLELLEKSAENSKNGIKNSNENKDPTEEFLHGLPPTLKKEIKDNNLTLPTPMFLQQYYKYKSDGKWLAEYEHNRPMLNKTVFCNRKLRELCVKKDYTQKYSLMKYKLDDEMVGDSDGNVRYLRCASPEILQEMRFTDSRHSLKIYKHVLTQRYGTYAVRKGYFQSDKYQPTPETSPVPETMVVGNDDDVQISMDINEDIDVDAVDINMNVDDIIPMPVDIDIGMDDDIGQNVEIEDIMQQISDDVIVDEMEEKMEMEVEIVNDNVFEISENTINDENDIQIGSVVVDENANETNEQSEEQESKQLMVESSIAEIVNDVIVNDVIVNDVNVSDINDNGISTPPLEMDENENEMEQKPSVERMWTVTDPETGDKGSRLHRKNENNVDNDAVDDDEKEMKEVVETPSVQRMWTKTNPQSGQKEERLHRKSTAETLEQESI